MSLWIKICANTSLEDARLAAEAGADAVGFVFAPSPRRVTVEQVASIVPRLPAGIEKIGVFIDAPFAPIAAAIEACALTGAQLHFDAPRALSAQLRERFGKGFRVVRTVHFNVDGSAPLDAAIQQSANIDANIDAILVDSRTATAAGGTGIAFDWSLAAETLFQNTRARERRVIAAGGLNPENVAEAIRILKPWGVDVASGVERAPGLKDARKLRAFVENARRLASAQAASL